MTNTVIVHIVRLLYVTVFLMDYIPNMPRQIKATLSAFLPWHRRNGTLPNSEGFTHIELLLLVGIVGVVLAVIVVAVNPSLQLAKAQDSRRRSHANELRKAFLQHSILHKKFPGSQTIPDNKDDALPICRDSVIDEACINVDYFVTMEFIDAIPVDPLEKDSRFTGFAVYFDDTDRPVVLATYLGSYRATQERNNS